nr:MAG TPA: hypothetical protein [Bacteriophage sp.]
MKEFKSTDEILNTIYKSMCKDASIYERTYVSGILTGSLIYSYTINNIPHSEFTELLKLIREMIR